MVFMRNGKKIAILMATYNGEKYLHQQIDSIISQTNKDWTLFVHDDGSSDNTKDILKDYSAKYDDVVLLDYPSQGGSCKNFMSMLESVESEYYMFCDQDDVWLENKIDVTLNYIKLEEVIDSSKAIVAFTDLYVVDSKLNVICESFWKYSGIYPSRVHSFSDLAQTTLMTGCTMMFNDNMKKLIRYPYNKAEMHDSWISACAYRYGATVIPICKSLMYYRQHGENVLGAVGAETYNVKYKLCNFFSMFQVNLKRYLMLRSLGYGSFIKFLRYKKKYKAYKN